MQGHCDDHHGVFRPGWVGRKAVVCGLGGRLKYARLATVLACVCAVSASLAHTVTAEGFLGFRLLKLDGTPVRWAASNDGVTRVTYAIVTVDSRFPNARNCKRIVAPGDLLAASGISRVTFEVEVRAAFAMWAQATNIDFAETDDAAHAGILIGAQSEPTGHAFANVDYSPVEGAVRRIERSLICLNPSKKWKAGFDGRLAVYDLRYTIAHEIGHAIGLDHPESSHQLMSFAYSEQFRQLQEGDLAGAIRIYGERVPQRPDQSSIATSSTTRQVPAP